MKLINKILFKLIEIIERIQYRNIELDQSNILKKIINIIPINKDIKIESPNGWTNILEVNETQPYKIWYLETETGKNMYCADTHILFDNQKTQIFVKDLKIGRYIQTKTGIEKIVKLYQYNSSNSMIDFTVNNDDMCYYSNDILNHNTITSAITILHYCIFNSNKGIMIVANKHETVVEILDKIKNIYKLLPFFMKPGVINWNQKAIVFDNGCRIKSQARSKEPAIGFTIDFLYMDEFAHIPRNIINHFYRAAVPTVSSIKGSKIIITSTPNGANLFKDLVVAAKLPEGHPQKNQYKFVKVMWYQVPDGEYMLDDGTKIKGTRLDPILKFKDKQIKEYGYTKQQLFDMFKQNGFICRREQTEDEGGINDFIKILYEKDKSDLDIIRRIKINKISISKFFIISNWKENETKLIGGEENFNQEYNVQFIAGSKLVINANKSTELDKRAVKFKETDIPEINELKFPVNSVRFDPEFDMRELHKYYWVTCTDMSEGLGQDYSVINGFRLMVKDIEWLKENKIQSMYDAFYLKQTFVIQDNELGNRTLFPELYYQVHFKMLNPERVKAVLEMNGPADGMMGALPGVFNSNNEFGKYIFAKFKQKSDDKPKIGYKVTNNKKTLVKQYIDSVENDNLYVLDEATIEEMGNFIKVELPSGNFTYRADSGHDDCVMSNIGGANYLLTQDFKNLCAMYYMELPHSLKNAIDNALDSNYNKVNPMKRMSKMTGLKNIFK